MKKENSNSKFLEKLKNSELPTEYYKQGAILDRHQARRHLFVKKLISNNTGSTALDIGCGFGDITNAISDQFKTIIGADIVQDRMRWASNEYPQIKFIVSDACLLPFKKNTFDTVLSIVILNWLDTPTDHFTGIKNVLSSNGELILMVKAPNMLRIFIRKCIGKKQIENTTFAIKNISNLLEKENFKLINISPFYESVQDSISSPKSFIAFLLLLPFRVLKIAYFADYYAITAKNIK